VKRLLVFAMAVAAVWCLGMCVRVIAAGANSDSGVQVQMSTDGAGPRHIEDATAAAVTRDYGIAWKSLESALSENRAEALDAGLVGFARDRVANRIADEKRSGLRTRFIDHGHKVQAIFYSPEGSTMQLRDTATVEVQVLDGDKVISSENAVRNYIGLMSVTEDRWKLRVLQEVQ
jgi:hypothetical protein